MYMGGVVSPETDIPAENTTESFPTVTLLDVLVHVNAPKVIDYLSLDIEGSEAIVMSRFPLGEYTFLVLTVERPKPPLVELLRQNDYVHLKDHGDFGDKMFIHKSLPNFEGVMAAYHSRH